MERVGRRLEERFTFLRSFGGEEKLLPGLCSRAQCFLIVWVLCFYSSPRNWGLGELWLWFARSTKADGILKLHPLKTLYAFTWATDWCLFLKHLERKFTTFSRFLNHPCPLPYPHKECLRDCAQKLLMALLSGVDKWTHIRTSGGLMRMCLPVPQPLFQGCGKAGRKPCFIFLSSSHHSLFFLFCVSGTFGNKTPVVVKMFCASQLGFNLSSSFFIHSSPEKQNVKELLRLVHYFSCFS